MSKFCFSYLEKNWREKLREERPILLFVFIFSLQGQQMIWKLSTGNFHLQSLILSFWFNTLLLSFGDLPLAFKSASYNKHTGTLYHKIIYLSLSEHADRRNKPVLLRLQPILLNPLQQIWWRIVTLLLLWNRPTKTYYILTGIFKNLGHQKEL